MATKKKVIKKIGIGAALTFAVALCAVGAETTHIMYGKSWETRTYDIGKYENTDDPWDKTLGGIKYVEEKNNSGSSYLVYDCWEDGKREVTLGMLGTEWDITWIGNLYQPHAFR